MAKATTRFVEETVTTVISKKDGVVLELDKDEADFLISALGFFGGCPDNSRRKYQVTITAALRAGGALYNTYDMKGGGVFVVTAPSS